LASAPAGTLPALVFAHANGFPAGTYARLFEAWRAAGRAVHAIEKLGHDPARPPGTRWLHLRAELAEFAERAAERSGGPVHLVGHSLGGFLSVLVAHKRPELVRGVVLLDSPIVAGWRARALQFGQATGLARRWSPGRIARRRRHEWPDADAAHAHFAGKPAFARFGEGVLGDYVRAGTRPAPGRGVALAFDRDIEARIYDSLPNHIGRLLARKPLAAPVAFVGGTRSDEVRMVGLAATERLTAGRVAFVEGSHLFPLEDPAGTAKAVLAWLDRPPFL
jgi:pimeloyl-ACP methyl ester carboxylesterase